jgi:hypothetical protein
LANINTYAPIIYDKNNLAEKIKSHSYAYELPNQNEVDQLDEKSKLEVLILAHSYKALSNNQPIPYIVCTFYLQYKELEKKENVIKTILKTENENIYNNIYKKDIENILTKEKVIENILNNRKLSENFYENYEKLPKKYTF